MEHNKKKSKCSRMLTVKKKQSNMTFFMLVYIYIP